MPSSKSIYQAQFTPYLSRDHNQTFKNAVTRVRKRGPSPQKCLQTHTTSDTTHMCIPAEKSRKKTNVENPISRLGFHWDQQTTSPQTSTPISLDAHIDQHNQRSCMEDHLGNGDGYFPTFPINMLGRSPQCGAMTSIAMTSSSDSIHPNIDIEWAVREEDRYRMDNSEDGDAFTIPNKRQCLPQPTKQIATSRPSRLGQSIVLSANQLSPLPMDGNADFYASAETHSVKKEVNSPGEVYTTDDATEDPNSDSDASDSESCIGSPGDYYSCVNPRKIKLLVLLEKMKQLDNERSKLNVSFNEAMMDFVSEIPVEVKIEEGEGGGESSQAEEE